MSRETGTFHLDFRETAFQASFVVLKSQVKDITFFHLYFSKGGFL